MTYFKSTTKKLRKRFKTKKPISLFFRRFSKAEQREAMGYINYNKKRYDIHIDSSKSLDTQWLVLLHEWAHAISGPNKGHSDVWGKNHGKVIRFVHKTK